MSYLQNIIRTNAINLGGIITFQLARKADIASIPDPVSGVIYNSIIFNAGKGWKKWDVTIESTQLNSSDKNSREGSFHGNSISFKIPRDIPGIRDMLLKASDDEFILLLKDSAAKQKIFGLIEMPVRFAFEHGSGQTTTDGNFFECRFYYQGPDNIYFYEGAIASAPAGASPSIVKHNGVTIATLTSGQVLNIISDFGFTDFYTTE